MPQPPHLKLPLRLGTDGSFETVEQDTVDDVVQCVRVVTETPIGSRIELPTFGVPALEFSQPIPLGVILSAVYTWEPRAMVLVRAALAAGDELEADVTLEVSQ